MLKPTMRPLAAAILCCLPLAASAQAPGLQKSVDWSQPVSFSIKDAPMAEVFLKLFGDAKIRYLLTRPASEFIDGRTLTAKMENVPLRTVVQSLARTAGTNSGRSLEARFEKDICVIDVVDAKAVPPGPPADRSPVNALVNYTAEDQSVLQIVKKVLDGLRTGYRFHPDVRKALEARKVSVKFSSLALWQVFRQLFEGVPLDGKTILPWFDQERGLYVFLPVTPFAERDLTDLRLTLNAKDLPVSDALRKLYESADLGGYAYSPQDLAGAKATIGFSAKEPNAALQSLLKAAGLEEKLRGEETSGVLVVSPREFAQARPDCRITAHLKDVDVRYAIKAIMRIAGMNYTLDPLVMGTVTVDIADQPFRKALETVLSQAKTPLTLSYRVESGIYNVVPNKDYETWK